MDRKNVFHILLCSGDLHVKEIIKMILKKVDQKINFIGRKINGLKYNYFNPYFLKIKYLHKQIENLLGCIALCN